ncbi:MAG: glycerol-3-phosphate 1-O-acyltransferase [Gammaproteobacteria bacterium]
MTTNSLRKTALESGAGADSPWPADAHGSVVFLLDAPDRFEHELLREWIESERPQGARSDYRLLTLSADGDPLEGLDTLADDAWLQPVRVVWLPAERAEGGGLLQDLFFAWTERPSLFRRRRIVRSQPERMRLIAGQGAPLADLRKRYRDQAGGQDRGFADFVHRQALITLERAERLARGTRYKVARLLPEDVFANREFREQLANLAQQRDQSVAAVTDKAGDYLDEMAARQTPFTLDIAMALYRAAARSNHDPEIDVDEEQLRHVAELLGSRPVVFLISHKSMLDTIALSIVLFEANLPLPLTFGGINLNTPGLGALGRRAGIIFLRRSFQDNEIYKATFRRYIDYLIDKRFSLLWALEGTRSRTGKLLPPRYGLFNYVVESILRTQLFEVAFVPVTVAYDQITEVEDYATEQKGHDKKPEGATWIMRFLRRSAPHGRIFVRFGEELMLTDLIPKEQLEDGLDETEKQAVVQNLALQVAFRMNAATPITGTAIVTLILLAAGNRALSLKEIQFLTRVGLSLVRRRGLEIAGDPDFREPETLLATLEQLHSTGIVSFFDEGTERLYGITPDQHLKAAYYRNTAIHHFVLDALVEVALLRAADAKEGERESALYTYLEELRELFLFDFYFPRRQDYRAAVDEVLEERFPNWREALEEGPSGVRRLLGQSRLLLSHAVLRSFADAYRVVARALTEKGTEAVEDRAAFVSDCLKLGRQMRLQGRVFSEESVSKSLYDTAMKLAAHRGLLEGGKEAAEGREALLTELRDVRKALDTILEITLSGADDG